MMNLGAIVDTVKGKVFLPKDTKPSFAGRHVLVTGANTGLGLAAAKKFVELGAERVILAVRNVEKGEKAKERIERETGRVGICEVWELDMMDYASIKAFAEKVDREMTKLDIAVLNAGVFSTAFEVSKYGWERDIQTNLLSTVFLSLLLLPKLRSSKTADFTPVLELVSSSTHLRAQLQPAAREATSPLGFYNSSQIFEKFEQYTISKLFLQYAQSHLLDLVGVEQPSVHIIAVCPGAVDTEIARDFKGWWYMPFTKRLSSLLIMKTPEQGARAYISGVALGAKGHGKFWWTDQIQKPASLLVGEQNEQFRDKVWQDILRVLRKDVPEVDEVMSRKAGG